MSESTYRCTSYMSIVTLITLEEVFINMLPVIGCIIGLCTIYIIRTTLCFFLGVDMCGRTVMVVVGRNIPVTLIDLEKVPLCCYYDILSS